MPRQTATGEHVGEQVVDRFQGGSRLSPGAGTYGTARKRVAGSRTTTNRA
jgi:hypothetical protein